MSTTQMLYQAIAELSEEEKKALLLLLQASKNRKQKEDEVDAVMGILHEYANPDLIPLEKNASEEAAEEQEKIFWSEYRK